MRIGRNIRDLDVPFKDEIEFSKKNNFDLIQLWYTKGKISMVYEDDSVKAIINSKYCTILHGLFDVDDFEQYSNDFINTLIKLKHKEVILHPVIKSCEVTNDSKNRLYSNVLKLCNELDKYNITVYVENNHSNMKVFYELNEWKMFFDKAPKNVEFLLDVVHVMFCDDYSYMKQLVSIKRPKCLHIADTIKGMIGPKHLHIPIGTGIIDFEKIFNEIIPEYDDLIILEIKNLDKSIIESKAKILEIIDKSKHSH